MCSDPQARRQHDPVPAPSFLHERLRAADVARLAAVPRVDGAGAHAADVRREEYIQPSQTTTKKCDRSREEMYVTAFASNTRTLYKSVIMHSKTIAKLF